MEIEILGREEQELMDREEIEIEISHAEEATPSAAKVRDRISAELDLDPKTVEIRGIYSSSGLSTSKGFVRVHEEPIYDELPEAEVEEGEADEEPEQEDEEPDGEEESDGEEAEEPDNDVEEDEETEEEPEEEDEQEGGS